MFATDEQLAACVQQAENTVKDLHYRTGVLSRELAAIRQILQPSSAST